MSKPLKICYTIFKPIVILLAGSSFLFDKYLKKRLHNISMEEISQAIDLADENKALEEKHILKGLLNFGNTSVKQIMKPRTEVSCLDLSTDAQSLLNTVLDWNFSRIPVYEESFDQLDFVVSKQLTKNLSIGFKAQNLFDPVAARTQGGLPVRGFKYGRRYSLNLSTSI